MTTIAHASYSWSGGSESCLRFGPDTGPLVIAALPLFEEANRTRAFTVTILRALATRGIASLLPDLPGTGESLIDTQDATLASMRNAYRALVEHTARPVHAIGLRSGALLDTDARVAGRWHLSPQSGDDLLRDLTRIRQAGGGTDYAGNRLSDALIGELPGLTVHADARTIRLDTDPRPADAKIAGTPLWRRAEPGNDPLLAERLADDIAAWIASCAG